MNHIDLSILEFLNNFSRTQWLLDIIVNFISTNDFLKGGILVALIWSIWFRPNQLMGRENQTRIITNLFACISAIAIARVFAITLPFRQRPIHNEEIDFILPVGSNVQILSDWSSLPSDHSVLFFTLAFGIYFISKRAGIFALIYTSVFIALPRVYLGLHYPSDILAGVILGLAVALLADKSQWMMNISGAIQVFSTRRPELFYPLFFLCSYQVADMFSSSRALINLGIFFFKV